MPLEEEEFLNSPTGDGIEEEDVELTPGPGSDSIEEVKKYVPEGLRKLYDVYSYRHAAAILSSSCKNEFKDLQDALTGFRMTKDQIIRAGGNESEIPKIFSKALRPKSWFETRLTGNLVVTLTVHEEETTGKKVSKTVRKETIERKNFLDGHKSTT